MRGPMIITEGMKIYDEGVSEGVLQQQIESTKKMILDNVPDENIIHYTGISQETLDGLKIKIANGILKQQTSTAANMLYDEVPDEKIIKWTGISPELLEELKAKIDAAANDDEDEDEDEN